MQWYYHILHEFTLVGEYDEDTNLAVLKLISPNGINKIIKKRRVSLDSDSIIIDDLKRVFFMKIDQISSKDVDQLRMFFDTLSP